MPSQGNQPDGTGVKGLYNVNPDGTYTPIVSASNGGIIAPVIPSDLALPQAEIFMGDNTGVATNVPISGDIVADGYAGSLKLAEKITNKTGNSLLPGYLVQVQTNATGLTVAVLADNSTPIQSTYVVRDTILDNGLGYVYRTTLVSGLDTSTASSVGSPVYLGTTGGYVFDTKPVGVLVELVGFVKVKDAVVGSINFIEPVVIDPASDVSKTLPEYAILMGDNTNTAQPVYIQGDIAVDGYGGSLKQAQQAVNETGDKLVPGTLVHLAFDAGSNNYSIVKADYTTAATQATHVVKAPINNLSFGLVYSYASVGSLNTSAANAVGDAVYLGATGAFSFAPVGGKVSQIVGYVAVKDAVVGQIQFVSPVLLNPNLAFTGNALGGHTHSVTPTGTVDQATFTGASDTTSSDSAGTPAGTVDQATFSGNAMSGHTHFLAYTEKIGLTEQPNQRLHTGTITGTPQVGATLAQAVTLTTAVLAAVVSGTRLDVNTVAVGTFNTNNVVTGVNPDLSTFTFIPAELLLDVFVPGFGISTYMAVESNTGQALAPIISTSNLLTNEIRYYANGSSFETLHADGWISISFAYASAAVSSESAGTPAGSINAQNFTGNGLGGHTHTVTPTGTINAQNFSGASDTTSSVGAGTPAGTVA